MAYPFDTTVQKKKEPEQGFFSRVGSGIMDTVKGTLFGNMAAPPPAPEVDEKNLNQAVDRVFKADSTRGKEGEIPLSQAWFPKSITKDMDKEDVIDMAYSKLVEKKIDFAKRSAMGEARGTFTQEAIGETADSVLGFVTGDRGGKRGVFNQSMPEQIEILEEFLKKNAPEKLDDLKAMDIQGESPVAQAVGSFTGEITPGILVGSQLLKVTSALPAMQKLAQGGKWSRRAYVQLQSAASEMAALGTYAFKDDKDASEWMREVAASPSLIVPMVFPHSRIASGLVGGLADYYTGLAVGMDKNEALVNGLAGAFGASVDTSQLRKVEPSIIKDIRNTAMEEANRILDMRRAGEIDAKTAKRMMESAEQAVAAKAKSLGVSIEKKADDAVDVFKKNVSTKQTAGLETPQAKAKARKDVAKRIEAQNAKMTDEAIVKTRQEQLLNPESIDEIILRKRGVISDTEAIDRAKRLKLTEEEILNLPKGTTLNKEQHTALRQTLEQERNINKQLKQLKDKFIDGTATALSREERRLLEQSMGKSLFDPSMTDEALINSALGEQTLKLKKMEMIDYGVRSEGGRALQGMKQQVGAVDARMRSIFQRMKGKTELEQDALMRTLADIDIEDPKQFVKFLEKLDSADNFDKVAEWVVSVKLWNPTTHVVNFTSNAARQALDLATTAIAEPRQFIADLQGARVGAGKGLRRAMRAMTDEGYAADLSKFVEAGGRTPAFKGKFGRAVRAPFVALAAGDELFKGIAFERSMYRQAHKLANGDKAIMEELLSKPTFEMMEKASEQAKRMTFQEDMGEIMRAVNSLRDPSRFRSRGGKTFGVTMRAFLPFLKTPTNLFKQAIDLSPAGIGKNLYLAKSNPTEFKRRLAEAAIGSTIMAYTYMQAKDGLITGGAPKDAKERDQFYREGKIPYSIKIGDKWYQYKRVDPLSTVIGLTADLVDDEDAKSVGGIWNIITEQLRDKTFLQGVSDLLDGFTGESWERDRVIRNLVTGNMMPSIAAHTARSIDPTIRDTKGGIVDAMKSQVPVVSKTVPGKVDVFGNTIERANQGLNYFFNPFQSNDAGGVDPVTKELVQVGYSLPLPQRYFTRDGVKYEFTPKEYEKFSREAGQEMYRRMEIMLKLDSYKRQTIDEKIDTLQRVRTDVHTEFKDKYLQEKIDKGEISKDVFSGRKPKNTSTGVARDVLRQARRSERARPGVRTPSSSIFLPPR